MADPVSSKRAAIALGAALLALLVGWRVCSKGDPGKEAAEPAGSGTPVNGASGGSGERGPIGLSAPIAAAYAGNGEVVVAGLDAQAKVVRVQRIDANAKVVADGAAFDDLKWSADSDLKLVAHPTEGVAVTWRGLRGGKLVRQLAILGLDLANKGEPAEVDAASCATRDAIWFSDGAKAVARPWTGPSMKVDLPKDKDVSLLCGTSRAFAIVDDDDRTSLLTIGKEAGPAIAVIREGDFAEDEQRELAEYTIGDDVGFVRIGASGAIAVRELTSGALGPLRKLKATIPKDDDVVAVDASSKILTIVHTQDASSACPAEGSAVATKVTALRIDRATFEESTVELSPGRCGHEVGPFFTGVLGDGVSIAWVERSGGAGKARAPITALAHATVMPSGTPALAHVDQPADALVDAGCDGKTCYAVALVRRETPDVPGLAKVLRYE